ncbi:MAG: acyl-CoA dehydrogenase family protein, partial [Gammaproteobacteria bacterium]|nr:acyl-CoA dehydrogenase family protein [Gammaproteobacteria bacterium]
MNQPVSLDPQEKRLFVDNLQRFLKEEVAPHYDDWEKAGIWPRALWRRFGEQGFLCVDVPEAYGGYGVSFELSCLVVDEVSKFGFGALASGLSVHSDIVAPYILNLGSEAQK